MQKGKCVMTTYKPIPEFSQFVEYITQGELVDGEYQVVVNHVDLSQQDIVPAAETLKAGYEHVDTLGRLPAIEGQELDGVKVKLAETYHDDIVVEATKTSNPINITGTVVEVKSHPDWKIGESVQVGDVRFFGNNLYKCIQPHTTQADWLPTVAFTLWNRFFAPGDPQIAYWVEWYAYKVGDEVIYEPNGLKYRCLQAHTSQPTWTPPAVPALWSLV